MKDSHMIDYVIIRADQQVLYVDVQVIRDQLLVWPLYGQGQGKIPVTSLEKVSPSTLPLALHMLQRV